MPLPPELQARLSKRGLLKQKREGEASEGKSSATVSKPAVDNTETLVLPPNWKKVLDEKTSHPYFWNTKTHEVSWHLPPGTKTVSENKPQPKPQPQPKAPPDVQMPTVTVRSKSETVEREYKERGTNRPAPYKISKKPRRYKPASDDLDPMDPAAYSDIAKYLPPFPGLRMKGLRMKL